MRTCSKGCLPSDLCRPGLSQVKNFWATLPLCSSTQQPWRGAGPLVELHKHSEQAALQAGGCQTLPHDSKQETNLPSAFPGLSWVLQIARTPSHPEMMLQYTQHGGFASQRA